MTGSMFSPIIDFCIGMSFFFLMMTLVCTMINEYIMDKFGNLRQKTLLEGISGIFYDAQRVVDFYKHPLITALYKDDNKQPKDPTADQTDRKPGEQRLDSYKKSFQGVTATLPSYIPSRTFAMALLDILTPAANQDFPQELQKVREAVANIDNDRIKKALLPLIDEAKNDLEKARQNIAKWYDDVMDRVGGWFKRQAKRWLLLLGLVVCVALNADTIMVGKILWQNPERLDAVAAAAQKWVDQGKPGSTQPGKSLEEIKKEINASQLPIGWVFDTDPGNKDPRKFVPYDKKIGEIFWDKIFLKALGLFFTAVAISLGAPFWTDLLNSFVNLRRGGKKPASAEEEKK